MPNACETPRPRRVCIPIRRREGDIAVTPRRIMPDAACRTESSAVLPDSAGRTTPPIRFQSAKSGRKQPHAGAHATDPHQRPESDEARPQYQRRRTKRLPPRPKRRRGGRRRGRWRCRLSGSSRARSRGWHGVHGDSPPPGDMPPRDCLPWRDVNRARGDIG